MIQKINKTDTSILKMLQEDSSRTYKQIASLLHKSCTTITNRIKWLMENGFITKTVAILNPKKLDLMIQAYIYLRLENYSDDALAPFKREIAEIDGICACTNITGTLNIKLKVITHDTSSLAAIKRKVAGINGVREMSGYIVLDHLIVYSGFNFEGTN